MFVYIFPFFYFFQSRLKSWQERFSWFLHHPLPIFILTYLFTEIQLSSLFLLFLLALFSLQSIYEVGYLENDVITTKKEQYPTLRFSCTMLLKLEQLYHLLSIFKIAVTCAAVMLIGVLSDRLNIFIDVYRTIILLVIIRIIFYAHNALRSRWNILTYFLLSTSQYIFMPLVFSVKEIPSVLVLAISIFPAVRTIEHATKLKYGFDKIRNIVGNIDLFRMRYYLTTTLVGILLYFVFSSKPTFIFLIIHAYFLLYRGLILLFINKVNTKRSLHPAYDWGKKNQ